MTTPGTTTAGTTTPGTSTTKPTTGSLRRHRRSLAVLGASVTAAALFGLASPAFAGQGPVAPAFQGFGPGPTTTVPDPEVNIELPNVGLVTPTTPPETIPPQPPDPQVDPDVQPDADDVAAPPEAPPEPPPLDENGDAPQECEPFDPAAPVVDMIDGNGTATVELSFQGDDQLQVCVTPLVIASYELDQPTLGGAAKLVDHTVVSSEDLDDWLLTGDPHTVTVDVEGCYHAVVVFWDVAIPLDLDGVSDPSHLLALRTGGDGCGSPGGGGRLPDTGTEAMRLVGLAAALVATGLTVVLLAHRRRVVV